MSRTDRILASAEQQVMQRQYIEALRSALDAFEAAPSGTTYRAFTHACEAPRQELMRRLNAVPGGTERLVQMRADLRRLGGDEAALAYAKKFDKYEGEIILSPEAIAAAAAQVPDKLKRDIEFSHANVKRFAEAQLGTVRDFEVEVVPGISSLSLLAARHRLVLHDVARPLHVTTARRLPEAIAQGQRNVVVMLNRRIELAGLGVDDWSIWWAANLGAPGEQAVRGRVVDVLGRVAAARERAAEVDGWVMDLYLLRAPA